MTTTIGLAETLVLATVLLVLAVGYNKFAGPRRAAQATPVAVAVAANDRKEKETTPDDRAGITPLPEHDYTQVPPTKWRNFKPIYHITMGLKNTTPSELITVDSDYPDRVLLRRSLIEAKGSGVYGVARDSNGAGAAAVRELYTYLLDNYLPTRYPTVFTRDAAAGTTTNNVTGTTHPSVLADTSDDAAEGALRVLAETVEEDLFFLTQLADGTHRCVAFVCCFPSGFDPAEKLGKGLSAIHEPVPSYDKIGPSMERFFGKLEVGKPVSRSNWSVQTHGGLHNLASNHIKGDEDANPGEVDGSKCHFRCEYQNLTRLPETRALLFSFKSYLYPLSEVKAEGLGPALADAIEGLQKGNAPGMWRYKAAVRWGPKACEFLRE